MHDTGPEQRFLAHLEQVERIIAFVARRRRLDAGEVDEFASVVRLKLIENDYEVLRRFEGRSSLKTYLTVVIQRFYLDYRVSTWGKWRPSAEARRLGPTAVLLERLTARDGMSFSEAVQAARTNHGVPEDDRALFDIGAKLPQRTRRQFVDDGTLESTLAAPAAADGVESGEFAEAASRTAAALDAALRELPDQDRLILKLRFENGLQVAEIARVTRLEQKPLYRRIE